MRTYPHRCCNPACASNGRASSPFVRFIKCTQDASGGTRGQSGVKLRSGNGGTWPTVDEVLDEVLDEVPTQALLKGRRFGDRVGDRVGDRFPHHKEPFTFNITYDMLVMTYNSTVQ